jgi:hypothetical protein
VENVRQRSYFCPTLDVCVLLLHMFIVRLRAARLNSTAISWVFRTLKIALFHTGMLAKMRETEKG